MILYILLLIIGFVLLIKCADWFVDGAGSLAAHFKVPKMIIALTVVAFGTSAPELAVSLSAMFNGNSDIVLGNVIGSNILNVLLILGVTSVFHNIDVKSNTIKKEMPILVLISVLLVVLINDSFFDIGMNNMLTISDGVVILLFFMVFVYYLIYTIRKGNQEESVPQFKRVKSIVLTTVGIVGVIIGGELVVNNAVGIAKVLGLSEKFISLTIVSIGTSLPEFVTSITAARKGEQDIAIGNIVGSSIFNIGCILGLCLVLGGSMTDISFNIVDLLVMVLSSVLLYITARRDGRITSREGLVFLSIFFFYMAYLFIGI